jgi:uncharacterized Zn-binding protein involved in type VI secretion
MAHRLFSDACYTRAVAAIGTPPYEHTGSVVFDFATMVANALPPASHNDPLAIAEYFLTRAYGGKWTSIDLAAVAQALSVDVNGVPAALPTAVNARAERLGLGVMAAMSMNQALLR